MTYSYNQGRYFSLGKTEYNKSIQSADPKLRGVFCNFNKCNILNFTKFLKFYKFVGKIIFISKLSKFKDLEVGLIFSKIFLKFLNFKENIAIDQKDF